MVVSAEINSSSEKVIVKLSVSLGLIYFTQRVSGSPPVVATAISITLAVTPDVPPVTIVPL